MLVSYFGVILCIIWVNESAEQCLYTEWSNHISSMDYSYIVGTRGHIIWIIYACDQRFESILWLWPLHISLFIWMLIFTFRVNCVYCNTTGLYSLSGGTSYRQITWSLAAARLDVIMIVSLWNLTVKFHGEYRPESRRFETMPDHAVRRPSA